MSESVRTFFETLPGRIEPEKLAGVSATYRFDVDQVGSWRVAVEGGAVTVDETDAPAECVIGASEKTLMRIVTGQQNPAAALMLGKLRIEGDMTLALRLKDLL
jgi:putative sterol carrier protein